MIIKTNQYTGNFERELMAYVFGYDGCDGYARSELNIFDKEMGEEIKDIFYKYFDTFAFGKHDPEYTCYEIGSHPTNKGYNCDSIFIALNDEFPKDLCKIVAKRLKKFCEYYNNEHNKNLVILNADYFRNKFVKQKEFFSEK